MSWEPPSQFDEYRIVRTLGAGAMGQVFLAHDTLLDRPVAIKFVAAAHVGAAMRERFFVEARAVARLAHPNVVAIHRVGELGPRPYLVSEYVRGTSLAAVVQPVPWERALRIALGLARGLAVAHRRGVLHRDIKPANVMLGDDDEAKLLDFGLAKLLGDAPLLATSPGKPAAATHRSDPAATAPAGGDPAAPAGGERDDPSATASVGGERDDPSATASVGERDDPAATASVAARRGAPVGGERDDPAATASVAARRGAPIGGERDDPSATASVGERDDPAATASVAARRGAPVGGERTGPPTTLSLAARGGAEVDPRNLTIDGTIVGTPLYLSPELWRGSPATVRSDLYALGVVMHELLVGRPPHARDAGLAELQHRVCSTDPPPVAKLVADVPARFAALVDACLARDPSARPESVEALCEALERVAGRDLPAVEGSPYRGLSAFEPEHRAVFFGRAEEARAVVERLRTETFVVVAGDSGAGKSSLCRAAVLPAIAEKALAGRRWRTVTMLPGARPLARLDEALATRAPDEGLLVFIDQLEELLTLAEPAEGNTAAERIAELVVAGSGVRVLASARGDYLGRLAALPLLGELVGRALFLLGPLGERDLRDAIAGPARALGYDIAAEVVDELVDSGRRNLPLLQFTLAELWDARDDKARTIPAAALAKIGGVAGALARRADQVMAALGDADRDIAWRVLTRLSTAEGTRNVTSRRELAEVIGDGAAVERVVERLVAARLLAVADGDERVEVAHEALFTAWPRLVAWRRTHDEGARMRDLQAEAARAWDQQGRPRGLLWRGDALAVYRAWRRAWPEQPSGVEAAFAAASEADARRTRRIRYASLAVVLAVMSAGIVVLYRSDRRAETERDEAVAQRSEAERQRRELLVEHGAQELAAGHAARALPYLVEALRQGDDTPANRLLIAEAARTVERRVATVRDAPSGYANVAWSPDGTKFVATAIDGTIAIYERGGAVVRRAKLTAFHSAVLWASANLVWRGDRIIFLETGRAHVWDATTGAMTRLDHDDVAMFAVHPSGRIATLSATQLREWDERGARLRELTGIRCFDYLGDGLVVVDHDGALATIDATGARTPRARIEVPHACAVRTAPGAARVLTAGARVQVWDAATFAQVGPTLPATYATFSGDGALLATPGTTGAFVWDLRTLEQVGSFAGAASRPWGAPLLDHGGRRMFVYGADRSHRMWDVAEGVVEWHYEPTTTTPTGRASSARTIAAAFSPDDRYLLVATGNELAVERAGREPLLDELRLASFAAQPSPDDRAIAFAGDGHFGVWDRATGALRFRHLLAYDFHLPFAITWGDLRLWNVAWSPDGARLLVGGGAGLAIHTAQGDLVRRLTTDGIRRAAWSPDGTRIAAASGDVAIWDAATGTTVATLPHAGGAVAWSSDGRRLATATGDGVLRVWDVAARRVDVELREELAFLDVAWSPDDTRLIATTNSGVTGVYDVATRRRVLSLTGQMGSATTARWSPDGALLAASGIDGTTRIWDAATGRQLVSRTSRGESLEVAWTHDGARLVVATDTAVRVWSMERDRRSVAELDALVRDRVAWRLVDGRLELAR